MPVRALAVLALFAAPLQVAGSIIPGGNDATAEAIQALDTDHSGKVEKEEVEAFARSQGLSPDDVRNEFRSLDVNGDGELEASEISHTLSDDKPKKAAIAPSSPGAMNELRVEDVESEAQRFAGKALAEVFARTAAKALESRSQDAEKASKLEDAAKNLRGQTAEIRRTAAQQTAQAAKDAAAAVVREAVGQVKQLEEEATLAEKQAVAKRQEARKAMERALEAQASMTANMNKIRAQAAAAAAPVTNLARQESA